MSSIPIPPEIYFSDFSFDQKVYAVIRNQVEVNKYNGLDNVEASEHYIHLMLPCDIKAGDQLHVNGLRLTVSRVELDTYDGADALLKAFVTEKI